jgi:hypothetical protein
MGIFTSSHDFHKSNSIMFLIIKMVKSFLLVKIAWRSINYFFFYNNYGIIIGLWNGFGYSFGTYN